MKARLLIVEDHEDMRLLWKIQLGQRGIEPVFASTASEALTCFGDGSDFETVVTDFTLPDSSGADLIQKLRSIDPQLPCILVTGHAKGVVREFIPDDVPILTKPIQIGELIRILSIGPESASRARSPTSEP